MLILLANPTGLSGVELLGSADFDVRGARFFLGAGRASSLESPAASADLLDPIAVVLSTPIVGAALVRLDVDEATSEASANLLDVDAED